MSRSMLTRQKIKSRDATSQGSIILNWLPFIVDHQSPRFEPRILRVPLESFQAPSQLCRKLFAEAIKDEFKLIVDEFSIEFWKPKDAVPIKGYSQAVERMSTSGVNDDFEKILPPLPFSEELDEATLITTNLHIFVTAKVGEVPHDEKQDVITGLSPFQLSQHSREARTISFRRLQVRRVCSPPSP
ncbi:hypothetical protein CPC08DRAFT_141702 [Agrocybe pediades]|nr:hypothetical protein CPC08DRAFT_141702 [Agrocybe pediades]